MGVEDRTRRRCQARRGKGALIVYASACYHLIVVQKLDAELTPKTYLVNNVFSAADVALYGALHPTLVSHVK